MYKILINIPTDEKTGFLWVAKQRGGLRITNDPTKAKTFTQKRTMKYFIACYLAEYIPYKIIEQ